MIVVIESLPSTTPSINSFIFLIITSLLNRKKEKFTYSYKPYINFGSAPKVSLFAGLCHQGACTMHTPYDTATHIQLRHE